MQIDFHHTVTYVVARDAGFTHAEAEIIAYSAQYVDDATTEGTVYFSNGAVFNRISSAHKSLDLRNTVELANHYVWMPFHFLPGNGGKAAGENPDGSFIEKIICRPNSPVAQEMVRDAIIERDHACALHRLGITMHVYADTWAHRGFAGVIHPVNEVENAIETGNSKVFGKGLSGIIRGILDDAIPPLGHGRATVFPDMPFLKWQYRNGRGELIVRDNPKDFLEAADHMCMAMRRFIAGDPDKVTAGLCDSTRSQIAAKFAALTTDDEAKRHKSWLDSLRKGEFTVCGKVDIGDYFARGSDSWKADALGTSHDLPVHQYPHGFLGKNWKLFHDAVHTHRCNVVYKILPRYGICAA